MTHQQVLNRTLRALLVEFGEGDPILAAFMEHLRERTLDAGEELCVEGDPADRFWVVASGQLSVCLTDDEGEVIEVAQVTADELVGESALLQAGARRNATLRASEETLVAEIRVADLDLDPSTLRRLRDSVRAVDHDRARARIEALVGRACARLIETLGDGDVRELCRGEVVYHAGEPATEVFIVRAGGVWLHSGASESPYATLETGDCFGLESLFDSSTRPDTARVNVDSQLVAYEASGFMDVARESAELGPHLRAFDLGQRVLDPQNWRAVLFLPQFAFERSYRIAADAFVVDLQDAVPLSAKKAARTGLKRALENGDLSSKPVVVRINEATLATEHRADLDALVGHRGVFAIMPTMMEHPSELDALHEELSRRERAASLPVGYYRLLPLIETPGALNHAGEFARAGGGRNIGLLLGHGDLFRLTGALPHSETTLDYPRNAVVFAARAAGIAAFDTPYTKIRDPVGLERHAMQAKTHGFDGKCCVHPDQLEVVQRCLRPSAEEISWARRVEDARRLGGLRTLARRLASGVASEVSDRATDGMAVVDGQLVGPPHIKAAQRVLQSCARPRISAGSAEVVGRVVEHVLQGATQVGDELDNPYELTITAGMRDLWLQSFYTHDPAVSSVPFAETLGLTEQGRLPCPFMLGLYLCVTMSSTHGAIYHLGFRDAQQLAPIMVGDTIRQRIRLKRVRNTSDSRRAVVTTSRELISMAESKVLFRVDKLELYASQPQDLGVVPPTLDVSATPPTSSPGWSTLVSGTERALQERADISGLGRPSHSFSAGDLLLHSFARPIGISTNLALSTRFLVTHPIHLNHHAHDLGDGQGVVVSGGLVVSQVLGAVSRDVSHVVWQSVIAANNVRPVAPTDTVGALTYVAAVEAVPGCADLEVLVMKSLGVKNLTPSGELNGLRLPVELFELKTVSVSAYDDVCRRWGLEILDGRVVCDVVRRLVRVKPLVGGLGVPAQV